MRVLVAGHTGLPFGGISTYCEALLNSSLSQHASLSFVETSRGGQDVSSRGGWRLTDACSALQNIFRFLLVFLHARPQIVHIMTAQMPSMLKHGVMALIARSLGAKVIIQIHCSVSAMFPPNGRVLNWYSRFILMQCHGILILSEEWLQLKEKFPNISIRYIPNGIHLAPYLTLTRPNLNNASEPIRILYLGHLGTQKGILDLIEAAHLLGDQEFIIELVGEPFNAEASKSINERIRSYDFSQTIKVFPPEFGEQKLARFAHADIFVLPSHSEGMPISIIEGMAAGLPIIATAVGGIPDMLINASTGLLVQPENPDELATALNALINSSDDRLRLGNAARDVARNMYDIECIVPALVAFYRHLQN